MDDKLKIQTNRVLLNKNRFVGFNKSGINVVIIMV